MKLADIIFDITTALFAVLIAAWIGVCIYGLWTLFT